MKINTRVGGTKLLEFCQARHNLNHAYTVYHDKCAKVSEFLRRSFLAGY